MQKELAILEVVTRYRNCEVIYGVHVSSMWPVESTDQNKSPDMNFN